MTATWAILLEQAETTRRAGNVDAAVLLARQSGHAAPEQPGPAFLLCLLLLERRDREANDVLIRLEQFPTYGPGWEALGHGLAAAHPAAAGIAFERAAQAYETAEAASPSAAAAHRLGVVRRQLGNTIGARSALERATARDESLWAAWFLLGLLRQDANDPAGAVQAFQGAIAARPAYHEAEFNLAVVLQEAGDVDTALGHYARAWQLQPDSFGRVAQALVSPAVGRLWLDPGTLMRDLAART